ncbi:kinase-like domain-containing protein [Dipodascopsis tothii]|uniref:kinase-like domain-containing protein n=1 Tax=Dipodascopsis tothii TaxID=44089 RepID=UPI0034CEBF90
MAVYLTQPSAMSPLRGSFAGGHGAPALPSPTSPAFSEPAGLADEVSRWTELSVGEWLRSVNCAKYVELFADNHIDGEALLACDQNVLRELGILKVGDRVRLYVAIKNLRSKCYATQRPSRDSWAAAYTIKNGVVLMPQRPVGVPQSPTDPTAARAPPGSPATVPGAGVASSAPTTPAAATSTPVQTSVSAPAPGSGAAAATQTAKYGNSNRHSYVVPQSTSPLVSPSTDTPPMRSPAESMPQGTVKFIFPEGHTKLIDVSGHYNSTLIKKRALRKMGIRDDVELWGVHVHDKSGKVRAVEDEELVAICFAVGRREHERERLMLVKKGTAPDSEELHVSQQIFRNQLRASEKEARDARQTEPKEPSRHEPSLSLGSIESFSSQSSDVLKSARTNRLQQFFGQRPPSELISLNLAEYFPGHESRVLQQTVRNSIRRSKRISGLSGRMSTATISSFASGRESLPPVPSIGDAWLNAEGSSPVSGPGTHSSLYGHKRSSSVRNSVSSRRSVTARSFTSANERQRSLYDEEPIQEDGALDLDMPERSKSAGSVVSANSLGEQEEQREPSIASHHPQPSLSPLERPGSPFSFTKSDTMMSDNNSFIEVDSVDDIPEELSDDETSMEDRGPMKWIRGALIGTGSFGTVVLGLNALTGELMAVKQAELIKGDNNDQQRKKAMLDSLQREIELLRDLHHENIVQYLGFNSDGQFLNIFLEYVPGGSVYALLTTYGEFEEPLIRTFVRQILSGLNYLHGRDIIHRDIKGANVLVDNKGKIKISDFGISKRMDAGLLSTKHHRPSLQGSVYWMAPEVVKQTSYTVKADIWSLGCLVVEMFTGKHPFPEFSQMQALYKIGTMCAPEIPAVCSAEAQDFLRRAFELDHNKRPTAAELLAHEFLLPFMAADVATPETEVPPS